MLVSKIVKKVIRFLTAGESHGKGLTTIIDGFPSNLFLHADYINIQLARRQLGYGRGKRMKIEKDSVEIISGIRYGKTTGAPITFFIKNNDWENWKDILTVENTSVKTTTVTIPRPGHADLTGSIKYNFNDIRDSIERSSARETAVRVAACSVARKFLEEFDIKIGSIVESIGGIYSDSDKIENIFNNKFNIEQINKLSIDADKNSLRVIDANQEKRIRLKIKDAKKKGDTLGGTFYVFATGVPTGLGSFMQYDRRIDADIAFAMMSINAVKGVAIGEGFSSANKYGSQVHDEILLKEKKFLRKTNRAGGIEGGITNGEAIIVRVAMKPIATLMKPLQSVDLTTMKSVDSRRERSDFVAVPSCSVIAESMLCWVIANHFLEKYGGDSMEEVKRHFYSNKNENSK